MRTFFLDRKLDDKQCELALLAFPNFEPLMRHTGPTVFERIAATLRSWSQRVRERHRLGELDDRLLEDIGLTRECAQAEASKPFWR